MSLYNNKAALYAGLTFYSNSNGSEEITLLLGQSFVGQPKNAQHMHTLVSQLICKC